MLLGHWYLVQPGLSRDPITELVRWALWITPLEIVLMLIPTGMLDVLTGTVDDGWGGLSAGCGCSSRSRRSGCCSRRGPR